MKVKQIDEKSEELQTCIAWLKQNGYTDDEINTCSINSSSLYIATEQDKFKFIPFLIALGADPTKICQYKDQVTTFIHWVITKTNQNDFEMILDMLVLLDVNINAFNPEKISPFTCAILEDHYTKAEYLLRSGANPLLTEGLDCEIKEQYKKLISFYTNLIRNNVQYPIEDALTISIMINEHEMFEYFIGLSEREVAPEILYITALKIALDLKNVEIAEVIYNKWLNLNFHDKTDTSYKEASLKAISKQEIVILSYIIRHIPEFDLRLATDIFFEANILYEKEKIQPFLDLLYEVKNICTDDFYKDIDANSNTQALLGILRNGFNFNTNVKFTKKAHLDLLTAVKWLKNYEKSIPIRFKNNLEVANHSVFMALDRILHELCCEKKFHLIIPIILLKSNVELNSIQLAFKLKFFESDFNEYRELACYRTQQEAAYSDIYHSVFDAIQDQIKEIDKHHKLASLFSASSIKDLLFQSANDGLNQPKLKRWLTLYANYILQGTTHIILPEDLILANLQDTDYVLQLLSDLIEINIEIFYKGKIVSAYIPKKVNTSQIAIQLETWNNKYRAISTATIFELRALFGFEKTENDVTEIFKRDRKRISIHHDCITTQPDKPTTLKDLILGLRKKTDFSKFHNFSSVQLEIANAAKWLERYKKSIPVRFKHRLEQEEFKNANFASLDNIINELQKEKKLNFIIPIILLEFSDNISALELNSKFKVLQSHIVQYSDIMLQPTDIKSSFNDIFVAIFNAIQYQLNEHERNWNLEGVRQPSDIFTKIVSDAEKHPSNTSWLKSKIAGIFRTKPQPAFQDTANPIISENAINTLQQIADQFKINIEIYHANGNIIYFTPSFTATKPQLLQIEIYDGKFKAIEIMSVQEIAEILNLLELTKHEQAINTPPLTVEHIEKSDEIEENELSLNEESIYLERLPLSLNQITKHFNEINSEIIILLNSLTYHFEFVNDKFIGEILEKIFVLLKLLEHLLDELELADISISHQFQLKWQNYRETYLQQLDALLQIKVNEQTTFNPGEDLKGLICKILAMLIEHDKIEQVNSLYQSKLKSRLADLKALDLSIKNIDAYLLESEPEPPINYDDVDQKSYDLEAWFESNSSQIEQRYEEYCITMNEYDSNMAELVSSINQIIDEIQEARQLQQALVYQGKLTMEEYNKLQTAIRDLQQQKQYLLSSSNQIQEIISWLNAEISTTRNSWFEWKSIFNQNAKKCDECITAAENMPFGTQPELMGYSEHLGASLYGTQRYERLMDEAEEYEQAASNAQSNMDYFLALNRAYEAERSKLIDEITIVNELVKECDSALYTLQCSHESKEISEAVKNLSTEIDSINSNIEYLQTRLAAIKVINQPQINSLKVKIDELQATLQTIIADRDSLFHEYNRKQKEIEHEYNQIEKMLTTFYRKLEAKHQAYNDSYCDSIRYITQIRRTILEREFSEESYIELMKRNYDLLVELEESIPKINNKYRPSEEARSSTLSFKAYKPLLAKVIKENVESKNMSNSNKLDALNKSQIAKFSVEYITTPKHCGVFFKNDFTLKLTSNRFGFSNKAVSEIRSLFIKNSQSTKRYYISNAPYSEKYFVLANIRSSYDLDSIVVRYTQTDTPLFCRQPFAGCFEENMSSQERGELLERLIRSHLQKMGLDTDWYTKINGNQGIDIVAVRYTKTTNEIFKVYVLEVKFSKDGSPYLPKRKPEIINGQVLDVRQTDQIWFERTLERMKSYVPKDRNDQFRLERTLELLVTNRNKILFMGVSSDMHGTIDYINLSRKMRHATLESIAKLKQAASSQKSTKPQILEMSIYSSSHVRTTRQPLLHYHQEKQRTNWDKFKTFDSHQIFNLNRYARFRITRANLASMVQQKVSRTTNISSKIQSMQKQIQRRFVTYRRSNVTKISSRIRQTTFTNKLQFIRQSISTINRLRRNIIARIDTVRALIQNVRTNTPNRQARAQPRQQPYRSTLRNRVRARRNKLTLY